MAAAIGGFLALLKKAPEDESVRLARLCEALDRLVMEYHAAPDVEPATEMDAPEVPYEPLAARAAASFPELGHYADVCPAGGIDQKVGLGDAIDDLTDIARELSEVLWLLDHSGAEDAIWRFRFGYRTHWGDHLHRLRVYLHWTMH